MDSQWRGAGGVSALEAMIYARSKALVTAPTAEPITLSDALAHLNVTHSEDNAYVSALITVAREYIEQVTNRALVNSTWKAFYDDFDTFALPMPASSVTHVKYYDDLGSAAVTVDSADYRTDLNALPALLYLAYGKSWPASALRPTSGVEIQFVAGYGAAGSAVPASIKHAMKLLIGHWYEHREDVALSDGRMPATAVGVPRAVDALLANHRAHGVIL